MEGLDGIEGFHDTAACLCSQTIQESTSLHHWLSLAANHLMAYTKAKMLCKMALKRAFGVYVAQKADENRSLNTRESVITTEEMLV